MRHRSALKPRSRLKPLCRLLQAAALSSGGLAFAPQGQAADIGWTYTNAFWSTPTAWSTGAAPGTTDWAVFGIAPAGPPALSVVNARMQLLGVRFAAGANVLLGVDDELIVETGFINEDAAVRTVNVGATGEIRLGTGTVTGAVAFVNQGRIWLANTATAGADSSFTNMAGGRLDFEMFSSAHQTDIINQAAGQVSFNSGSTADQANIMNQAGGMVLFSGTSTAASATITNQAGASVSFVDTATAGTSSIWNLGTIGFQGNSTAGGATIGTDTTGVTVFGADASGGTATLNVAAGGLLGFGDRATAGDANITSAGTTAFTNDSRAGQATIFNGTGGTLQFINQATAENADILSEGALVFGGTASAGAATITTRAGSTTQFVDSATGGTSRIVMQGGTLDLTGHAGMVTVGSIEGLGVIDVAGGHALFAGTRNTDTTFAGTIVGGGGALGKVGTGTLTLTGANTYTSGTFVQAGTLQVGDGGTTGSITGNVVNDGALVFDRSDGLAFGGTISGTGRLEVRGLGLGLTADNTYSGGTTIGAGSTLQLGTGGTTGGIVGDVLNNGHLVFARSDVVTFGGRVSGTGDLTNAGGGLILTGNNSYSGTTTIGPPVVVGNGGTTGSLGTGPVINNSLLIIDRAGTLVMDNAISGPGAVIISGPGRVVFGGANTYAAGTEVEGGTLAVNGSIVGNARVGTGGTLGGTGRTGTVAVESGGTLAPGNSIGTLNVAGNLRFDAGSVLQVEVDPAGRTDHVAVDGFALISGGTVDVRAGGRGYARNTRYTLLTAAGGTTGAFDRATTNLAFLTPTLRYDGNSVVLDLQANRVTYGSVGLTPNQRSVGDYLQAFADAPATADGATLISQIDSLDAEGARRAFDNLSGSAHAVASQVATGVGRNLSATMAARTGFSAAAAGGSSAMILPTRLASVDAAHWEQRVAVASDGPPRAAGLGTAMAGAARAPGTGAWVQAVGGGGESDSDGNGPSSDYRNGGVILGYDFPVAAGWVAGASAGYVRSSWDADTGGTAQASGDLDSPLFGLYARYAAPAWRLHLDTTYVRHDFDARRRVAVGSTTQTASSSHGGHEWGIAAQVEFPRPWGDWEVAPLAGLRHARLSEDGFAESGAGAGNLTVSGRSTDQTVLSAGMQFAKRFASGQGGLELRAVASHLFGDADAPVTSQLAGQPARFTASGTPIERNALTLGATFAGAFSRNVSGYVDAACELRGSGQNAYGVAAGVRVSW